MNGVLRGRTTDQFRMLQRPFKNRCCTVIKGLGLRLRARFQGVPLHGTACPCARAAGEGGGQ